MSGEGRQREIITLQVGGLSNWVGAHQWNLDQANSSFSLDSPTQSFSDALYFGKCDKQSSERAPRLVAFDLRGRQGALFADEYALELESSPLDGVTWAGGVTKYVAEPLARNPYLTSLVSSGENGEASADSDRSADVRSGGGDDFAGEPRSATSFFDDEAWSSYGGSAFAERARALLLGSGDDEEEDDEKDGGEGGKSEGGSSSSLPSWAAEDPRMPRASSSPANDSTGSAGGGDPASALSQGDNDGAAKEKSVEVLPVPLPLRWSDFIEVHLKPKYLVEVPFWDVRNGPFSSFAAGNLNQASGCVLSVDERDEAMDRLRIVLEVGKLVCESGNVDTFFGLPRCSPSGQPPKSPNVPSLSTHNRDELIRRLSHPLRVHAGVRPRTGVAVHGGRAGWFWGVGCGSTRGGERPMPLCSHFRVRFARPARHAHRREGTLRAGQRRRRRPRGVDAVRLGAAAAGAGWA